jgi:hypothetical protein
MAISFRVQKRMLDTINEGIGSGSDQVLVGAHGNIYGYGYADLAMGIGVEHFRDLALAMMEANLDEAIKAFGEALKDGPSERQFRPLTVTSPNWKGAFEEAARKAVERMERSA